MLSIEPTEFVLHPGESREITLKFQEPAVADPALLPIYSGFIYATNTINGQVVHLSCKNSFYLSFHVHACAIFVDVGVVGNYADARIIVRNTSSDFITGVMISNSQYVSDEQLLTLNATEGFDIIIVTAWSTRLLFAEVVSAQDDSLPDSNFR